MPAPPHPVAALLLAAALLAGCTKPPEPGRTPLHVSVFGSAHTLQAEFAVFAAFRAAHPEIDLRVHAISSHYTHKIQTMMVGRVEPDVMLVELVQYHEWAARGRLADVSDLVREIQARWPLLPKARDAFEVGGRFMAVPLTAQGLCTYVNLDAFAAAGVALPPEGDFTWDWLECVAPRLARRAGAQTATADYLMAIPDPLLLIYAEGGRVFDDSRRPTRATADTPEVRAAFARLRRLVATGALLSPSATVDQSNSQLPLQLFRDGKVALHFSGRWDIRNLGDDARFKWTLLPVPRGPAGVVSFHRASGLAISSRTPHRAAAETFVRFYFSPENMERVIRGGRLVPAWQPLAYGASIAAQPPAGRLEIIARTMEQGGGEFPLYGPGSEAVLFELNQTFEQFFVRPDLDEGALARDLDATLDRWLARQKRKGLLP